MKPPVARTLRFEPGRIVVFDRSYTDYDWFISLDAGSVFFVTHMKDNADYGVLERRLVSERRTVRRDEPCSVGGVVARKQDGEALRQHAQKGVYATHQVATCSE